MHRVLLGCLAASLALAGPAMAASANFGLGPEPGPGISPAPGVVRQAPAVHRFTIGDATVTALSDGTTPLDLHRLMRGLNGTEMDALLDDGFLSNPVESSINCYLIELGRRTILIDTGAGPLFGPGNAGRLMDALAVAGIAPGKVTDILLTHAHPDHIGGLATRGHMNFANALIHVGKADVAAALAPSAAPRTGLAGLVAAMLMPYAEAGRLRPFDHDGQILPGISAQLRPGHSPGSAIFRLESRGQELVIIGDVIHVAAVQLPRPDATMTFDADENMARADRLELLKEFAHDASLIASPHISFPGVGRLRTEGNGYRWFPIEIGNRDPKAAPPVIP